MTSIKGKTDHTAPRLENNNRVHSSISKKIPLYLKNADRITDFIPVLSTLTNTFDLGVKLILKCFVDKETIGHNRYFKHLDKKSAATCFALLIPFVGNIGLASVKIYKYAKKAEIDKKVALMDGHEKVSFSRKEVLSIYKRNPELAYSVLTKVEDSELDKLVANHSDIAFSLVKIGIVKEIKDTKDSNTLFRDKNGASQIFMRILKNEFAASMKEHFENKSFIDIEPMNPILDSTPLEDFTEEEIAQLPQIRETVCKAVDEVLRRSRLVLEESSSKKTEDLFTFLHDKVSEKFPSEAEKQVVSMFFLRYQNVVISTPERFLFEGYATDAQKKNAILITALIQKMANFSFKKVDNKTAPFQDYIKDNGPETMRLFAQLLMNGPTQKRT